MIKLFQFSRNLNSKMIIEVYICKEWVCIIIEPVYKKLSFTELPKADIEFMTERREFL